MSVPFNPTSCVQLLWSCGGGARGERSRRALAGVVRALACCVCASTATEPLSCARSHLYCGRKSLGPIVMDAQVYHFQMTTSFIVFTIYIVHIMIILVLSTEASWDNLSVRLLSNVCAVSQPAIPLLPTISSTTFPLWRLTCVSIQLLLKCTTCESIQQLLKYNTIMTC